MEILLFVLILAGYVIAALTGAAIGAYAGFWAGHLIGMAVFYFLSPFFGQEGAGIAYVCFVVGGICLGAVLGGVGALGFVGKLGGGKPGDVVKEVAPAPTVEPPAELPSEDEVKRTPGEGI